MDSQGLHIFVGYPGKALHHVIKSSSDPSFFKSYHANRSIVLARGAVMLPVGGHEENIFGVDEDAVLRAIIAALRAKGTVRWGLKKVTKATVMQHSYEQPPALHGPMPALPRWEGTSWDVFAEWIRYLNKLKLSRPQIPIVNYFDCGLTAMVCMGYAADKKVSLLKDADGFLMIKEGSIGHTMSKMLQLATSESEKTRQAVYNFYIGDGACRLNGGMELAFDLMERYDSQAMMNLVVFNNEKWAIEDSLVGHECEQHHLYNRTYYDLLCKHPSVTLCETEKDFEATMTEISKKVHVFATGDGKPSFNVIVTRCFSKLPAEFGDRSAVRTSSDMKFMCDTLGYFAADCNRKVPLYSCSHFESIQYLDIFMNEKPEGKKYQYVCGRTDIQAAHMAGYLQPEGKCVLFINIIIIIIKGSYLQPEGKCVLFINDQYGLHSIGETIRMLMSGFGGRQLMIFIWHPLLTAPDDNFSWHRQPMVWPSPGPDYMRFFIRNAKDVHFHEFDGNPAPGVLKAISAGTPLIVINMLPLQERDYLQLDSRVSIDTQFKL
eukprot:g45862.t1